MALRVMARGSVPTPSEGVEKCRKTRLLGRSAEEIYGESGFRRGSCDLGGGIFADSHTEKLSSQQLRGFPAIQCRNMARTEHQGFTKKQHRPFFHSAALSVEMVWNARHETIQTYHKTAQMKLHAQNCTHAPKRSRLTTKRHDSLG